MCFRHEFHMVSVVIDHGPHMSACHMYTMRHIVGSVEYIHLFLIDNAILEMMMSNPLGPHQLCIQCTHCLPSHRISCLSEKLECAYKSADMRSFAAGGFSHLRFDSGSDECRGCTSWDLTEMRANEEYTHSILIVPQ